MDKGENLLHLYHRFSKECFSLECYTLWKSFSKEERLIHRLNGIQKYLSKKYSPFLLQLQHSLYIEYFNILNQEDIFWKLKSRVNWLNNGDKNTIFFSITLLFVEEEKIKFLP